MRARILRHPLLCASTLPALLLAAACGGDGGPSGPLPVATVVVSPANPGTLLPGETLQLTVTLLDADGNVLDEREVSWTSSDEDVATVAGNAQGATVTAVASGSATISATSEGETGSVSVTVDPVPVATVEVAPQDPTILVGEALQLTVTLEDDEGNELTGRTITYESSDESVATVDGDGLVTGMEAGVATVTATSEGVSGDTEVTVNRPDFDPDDDQSLSGQQSFANVTIPAGVTVTADADLTLDATGSVSIAGALVGECVALSLSGGADVEVTGTVENACADPGTTPPGLTLESDGPMTLDGATVESSGDILVRTDPELEVSDFPTPADGSGSLTSTDSRIAQSPGQAPDGGPGEDGADGHDITILVADDLTAETTVVQAQTGGDGGQEAVNGAGGEARGGDGGDGGRVRLFVAGSGSFGGAAGPGGGPTGLAVGARSVDAGRRGSEIPLFLTHRFRGPGPFVSPFPGWVSPADASRADGSGRRAIGSVTVTIFPGNGGNGADGVFTNDGSDPLDLNSDAFGGEGGSVLLPEVIINDPPTAPEGFVLGVPVPGAGGSGSSTAADGLASTEQDAPLAGGDATSFAGQNGLIMTPDCIFGAPGDCLVSGNGSTPEDRLLDPLVLDGSGFPGPPPVQIFQPLSNEHAFPLDGPTVEIHVGSGGPLTGDGFDMPGPGGVGLAGLVPGTRRIVVQGQSGDDQVLVESGEPSQLLLGGGIGGNATFDGCVPEPPVIGFPGGNGGEIQTIPNFFSSDLDRVRDLLDETGSNSMLLDGVNGIPPLSGGNGSPGDPVGPGGVPGMFWFFDPVNVDMVVDILDNPSSPPPGWGPPSFGLPGDPCVPPPPETDVFRIFFDGLPRNEFDEVPDGTHVREILDGAGGVIGTVPLITEAGPGGVFTSDEGDIGLIGGGRMIFDFFNGGFINGAPLPPNFDAPRLCPLFGFGVSPESPLTVRITRNGEVTVHAITSVPDNTGRTFPDFDCITIDAAGGSDELEVETEVGQGVFVFNVSQDPLIVPAPPRSDEGRPGNDGKP